jgi:hypothetical protein
MIKSLDTTIRYFRTSVIVRQPVRDSAEELPDRLLILAATRLFNQLYDRNCRRAFTEPSTWHWAEIQSASASNAFKLAAFAGIGSVALSSVPIRDISTDVENGESSDEDIEVVHSPSALLEPGGGANRVTDLASVQTCAAQILSTIPQVCFDRFFRETVFKLLSY